MIFSQAASPLPEPATVATDLVNGVGGEIVATNVAVWPVLAGLLLILAVIAAVLGKVGLRKRRSPLG